MKSFNNVSITNNYKGSAIAIGNFDGVHKGHQKIFRLAKKFAKKNKIRFGVLTFTPLPAMFFNKKVAGFPVYFLWVSGMEKLLHKSTFQVQRKTRAVYLEFFYIAKKNIIIHALLFLLSN